MTVWLCTVRQDGPTWILICIADCRELEQAAEKSENRWVFQEKTRRKIKRIICFLVIRTVKKKTELSWNHELFLCYLVWNLELFLFLLVWNQKLFCSTRVRGTRWRTTTTSNRRICYPPTWRTGYQWSGSMTFWCGSRSSDPCLWLRDPDPEPAIFDIDLQVFLLIT